MSDKLTKKETPQDDKQERMNRLVSEVTSKMPGEVGFLTRALLAVELAKDALDQEKITPEQALGFAQSLEEFSTVPVVLGVPECKIFPIELVMEARPAIVENYRRGAKENGIDFDKQCSELRSQAQAISDTLEMGADWLSRKYGPFALSPEAMQSEITQKLQAKVAARQILEGTGGTNEDQREASGMFMKLNFSNFMAGQDLEAYIKGNYQFSGVPRNQG